MAAPTRDDPASIVIPYKNVPALTGYYVAVFSLIPCIGGVLALVAIPLGIVGFRKARSTPGAHGTAHALVAMILGSIVLIAHLAILALIVFKG